MPTSSFANGTIGIVQVAELLRWAEDPSPEDFSALRTLFDQESGTEPDPEAIGQLFTTWGQTTPGRGDLSITPEQEAASLRNEAQWIEFLEAGGAPPPGADLEDASLSDAWSEWGRFTNNPNIYDSAPPPGTAPPGGDVYDPTSDTSAAPDYVVDAVGRSPRDLLPFNRASDFKNFAEDPSIGGLEDFIGGGLLGSLAGGGKKGGGGYDGEGGGKMGGKGGGGGKYGGDGGGGGKKGGGGDGGKKGGGGGKKGDSPGVSLAASPTFSGTSQPGQNPGISAMSQIVMSRLLR